MPSHTKTFSVFARLFWGRQKYDPCFKWRDEPAVEDDFASSGDFGVSAFIRALIKALEAQGRGFAHGFRVFHRDPFVVLLGATVEPLG